jgi:hypothetical protein
VVCNVLNESDCVTVSSGVSVSLSNGEVKIYVPR